jgi:hypothetical protein
MDTSIFELLIAHLGADDLPRLTGLLDKFLEAKEGAAGLWADSKAHFDGRLDAAIEALCAARRPLVALVPDVPERWGRLQRLGQLPPAVASVQDDASLQELHAFHAFVAQRAGPVQLEQYVTLDQAASLVSKSKKTVAGHMNKPDSDAPLPDVEGGGGRAHEWRWSALRPWLEQTFRRKLPEQFPTLRLRR